MGIVAHLAGTQDGRRGRCFVREGVMDLDLTGVEAVDWEHVRILDSLKAMARMVGRPHDRALTVKLISVFMYNMAEHSRREETFAEAAGVDADRLETMKKDHRLLMREYAEIRGKLAEAETAGTAGMIDWLKRLTLAHIAEIDVPTFTLTLKPAAPRTEPRARRTRTAIAPMATQPEWVAAPPALR
jgi:hemerythrin